jgi:DNA-binding transcriptional ArsR family regulator
MTLAPQKTDVFFAISDGTRRALLLRLAEEGVKNVTELMEPFSISQPAISKHLRCLRNARLVHQRRVGRMMFYEIDARNLRDVYDWVSHFERYWEQKLDALGTYLEKQKKKKSSTGKGIQA